ncbi:hypothetical protein T484DRAFT_1815910, partial [Baffinella frigidus]
MVKKGSTALKKKSGQAGQYEKWHLKGTVAEGTNCHKPATVSGGGKSEISKRLQDMIKYGPVFVPDIGKDFDQLDDLLTRDYSKDFVQLDDLLTRDYSKDFEQLDDLLTRDYSKVSTDPNKPPLEGEKPSSLLDPSVSQGSIIKLMTPQGSIIKLMTPQ